MENRERLAWTNKSAPRTLWAEVTDGNDTARSARYLMTFWLRLDVRVNLRLRRSVCESYDSSDSEARGSELEGYDSR